MIKRIMLLFVIVAAGVCGCRNQKPGNSEEVEKMTKETAGHEDDLTFMMTTYGLEKEELAGIDLKRLIEDYQMRTREYTAEEIREILTDEADMYQDDGSTALFAILEQEGGALEDTDQISRIGYFYNPGTLVQKAVFDLENKLFYVDNTDSHPLTEEQYKLLKELPEKWQITDWDEWYEGEEQESTGSFAWKLVFELADGSFCVYGGYTKDMSHLPKTYNDVNRELRSVMKSAGQ